MTSALIYPHIEKVAGQPARLHRIPRVRVAQIVMDYLAYGWSVEEMCRQHSYLMQSEAHAAMAYYFDFQVEIEQEIRTEWEQVQQVVSKSRCDSRSPLLNFKVRSPLLSESAIALQSCQIYSILPIISSGA